MLKKALVLVKAAADRERFRLKRVIAEKAWKIVAVERQLQQAQTEAASLEEENAALRSQVTEMRSQLEHHAIQTWMRAATVHLIPKEEFAALTVQTKRLRDEVCCQQGYGRRETYELDPEPVQDLSIEIQKLDKQVRGLGLK